MGETKDGDHEKAYPDASPLKIKSALTDIILSVEGEKLHFNKGMLMIASPVFRKMFRSDFKEKIPSEIPLPGQIHQMVAFLRCIHPEILDVIDDTNVFDVLPLVHEYQCQTLKSRCEQFLIGNIPEDQYAREKNIEHVIKCLMIGEKFDLKELLKSCEDCLSETHSFYLNGPTFDVISEERKQRILRKRIVSLEKHAKIYPTNYDDRLAFQDLVI